MSPLGSGGHMNIQCVCAIEMSYILQKEKKRKENVFSAAAVA